MEGNEKTNGLYQGDWSIEPAFSAPSICALFHLQPFFGFMTSNVTPFSN